MHQDPFYNPSVPTRIPSALVHDFNIYDYKGRNPFEVIYEMHCANVPEFFWTRHNGGHWVSLGAEAIAEVSTDVRRFSSLRPIVPDDQNFEDPIFIPVTSDPPMHTSYRNVLAPLFVPSRIAVLERDLRSYAIDVATQIKTRGRCDFMTEFGNEIPVAVFLRFLDLPLDDQWKLLALAAAVVKPEDDSHRDKPVTELMDYLRPIIEARFANPGTDIISQLVQRTVDGRQLRLDEMVKLTMSVLLGGLETTTSALGFITHHLAADPDARRYLRNNPGEIAKAVEEFLRRFSPAVAGRQANEDFEFRGVSIVRGDHVVWATSMYNLDVRHFDDPMTIDFQRKRKPHSSFGVGIHFCLGAFLARLELRIFIESWLSINPNFHVEPGAVIQYRTGLAMGFKNLPLIIDPD